MSSIIPDDLNKGLRACLLCHLIKHEEQFRKNGCENCEEFLGLRNHPDMVANCTTAAYKGMIALCQPEDSWVARWQKINRKVRGMYAIDVEGKLPRGIAQELSSMGVIEKRPRQET